MKEIVVYFKESSDTDLTLTTQEYTYMELLETNATAVSMVLEEDLVDYLLRCHKTEFNIILFKLYQTYFWN